MFKISLISIAIFLWSSHLLAVDNYQIEKVYPSPSKVSFKRVYIVENSSGFTVKGTVKKRSTSSYVGNGHIDLAVFTSNGDLVAETTARLSSSLNLRKLQRTRGVRFRAPLDITPPEGSTIKVAFHQNRKVALAKPNHESNVAR